MKIVSLLMLLTASLWAWNLAPFEDVPVWMQTQIEQEIKSYLPRFAQKDVKVSYTRIKAGLYGQSAPVAYVTFAQNKCQWQVPKACLQIHTKKAQNFALAVETLNKIKPLPEFELLLSLDACFERPYHKHLANVPVFSVAKSEKNTQVLMFPRGIFEPNREEKFERLLTKSKAHQTKQPKTLWRLKTFDRSCIEYDWRLGPTIPLLFMAKNNSDRLDFGIPKRCQSFVSSKVTGLLKNLYKPELTDENILDYSYHLAFDQRASPSDLEWQLFTGAVTLRAKSKFSEWFTPLLQPHEHYMPLDERCDALFETMEWCKNHAEEAAQIGKRAQKFASQHLKDQQIFSYFYHLLCSYAAMDKCDEEGTLK